MSERDSRIKELLWEQLDAERVIAPSSEGVIERGRRVRRRNAIASTVGAVMLVAGLAGLLVVIPNTAMEQRLDRREGAVGPGPGERGEPAIEERAAVFAVRAVAQAGLLDPLGDFWAYEETALSGDGWRISFTAFECFDKTCRGDTPAYLDVETEEETFMVSEAAGPLNAEQRDALLSFRQKVRDEAPRFEFPYIRVDPQNDRGEGWILRTSPLWTGPMPPPVPDYGSICRIEARDAEGTIVYRGNPFSMDVRGEKFRAGGMYTSEIPAELESAESVQIRCDEPGPR